MEASRVPLLEVLNREYIKGIMKDAIVSSYMIISKKDNIGEMSLPRDIIVHIFSYVTYLEIVANLGELKMVFDKYGLWPHLLRRDFGKEITDIVEAKHEYLRLTQIQLSIVGKFKNTVNNNRKYDRQIHIGITSTGYDAEYFFIKSPDPPYKVYKKKQMGGTYTYMLASEASFCKSDHTMMITPTAITTFHDDASYEQAILEYVRKGYVCLQRKYRKHYSNLLKGLKADIYMEIIDKPKSEKSRIAAYTDSLLTEEQLFPVDA